MRADGGEGRVPAAHVRAGFWHRSVQRRWRQWKNVPHRPARETRTVGSGGSAAVSWDEGSRVNRSSAHPRGYSSSPKLCHGKSR
jgi:hypothetical protein